MNSWCESCARKSCCYTMEIRPRCYVATTNTASGTPENYLAKSLRYSRDSHEIAKDEPQTKRPIQCSECRAWHRCFKEKPSYNMIKSRCPIDEPQTDMAEDIVRSYGFKAESYRQAKAKTENSSEKPNNSKERSSE